MLLALLFTLLPLQVDHPGVPLDGAWWVELQTLAKTEPVLVQRIRVAYVRGVYDGLDTATVLSTATPAAAQLRREGWVPKLPIAAILAKLDAYYADEARRSVRVSVAIVEMAGPER